MSKKIILPLLLVSLFSFNLSANGNNEAEERPPQNGRPERNVEYSDADIATIKAILSNYNPDDLSKATVESIFEDLKAEDIMAGPQLDKILQEAGYDMEALKEFLPPPPQGGGRS